MILWMAAQSLRRAPRRLILGALGVAFPVAMLAATLLFLDHAVQSMTRIALESVQTEQRALATSLDVNMNKVSSQLAAVPGVASVDRFAAADVFVNIPGSTTGGASARLFAVDPSYLKDHPWVRSVGGPWSGGALLGQTCRDYPQGFATAKKVTINLRGGGGGAGKPLTLPVTGTADLRNALQTWFSIPAGEVQGDVALVPRAIVIPYNTFQHKLLPALRAKLGPTTPVLNPSLTDLPPVTLEAHVDVSHSAYPSDPGQAAIWSGALRRVLERQTTAPGTIVVTDNAYEPLTEASSDATNAKILCVLLGIPGALVAAALGLAAQSALAEAQRREDGLMRLRGATEGQLAGLAAMDAAVAGVIGVILGLIVAFAAVSAGNGQAAWSNRAAGTIAVAILAAAGLGAATTGIRLYRLMRASRRSEIVAERRVLERGWRPLWLRAYLDFVAVAIGIGILAINWASGGLKPSLIEAAQQSTLALSFYVLLAPIALWIGLTLLAVRLLLAASRRWTRPDRDRPLPSWRGAILRWLGRRPARTGVALVLGILAVAFATEVLAFVGTYATAQHADSQPAFGSDLRITPGDPLNKLPPLGPHVASVSPIRELPARAETDRKTIATIDLATYSKTAAIAPRIDSGGGLAALAQDPKGILIDPTIASDFAVAPGDNLPPTLFPDDPDLSQNMNFHVVGIFRDFPPSNPYAEMVMSTAALPPYLVPPPDFYMAHDAGGQPPSAVAAALSSRPDIPKKFGGSTPADQTNALPRNPTAL